MYSIITKGNFNTPIFPYIYFGNAFYIYVGGDDRHLVGCDRGSRTLQDPQIYVYRPHPHPGLLAGTRCGALPERFAGGGDHHYVRCAVPACAAGPCRVDWPLFFVSLILGIAMLATMGLILASITLLVAHHFFLIGEAVASAYICSAAPSFPGRPAGLVETGWVRHSDHLLARADAPFTAGGVAQAFPTLAHFSNLQLLGILLGLSVVLA